MRCILFVSAFAFAVQGFFQYEPATMYFDDSSPKGNEPKQLKIRLLSAPRAPVFVAITPHRAGNLRDAIDTMVVSPCNLIFNSTNWNVYQTISIKSLNWLSSTLVNTTIALQLKTDYTDSVPRFQSDGSLCRRISSTYSIVRQLVPSKTCASAGDPHFVTFDAEEFSLYDRTENTVVTLLSSNETSIVTHQFQCVPGREIYCNTGIAIRHYDSLVVLSLDQSTNGTIRGITALKAYESHPNAQAPLVRCRSGTSLVKCNSITGNARTVVLDDKTEITVQTGFWPQNGVWAMNVYIRIPQGTYSNGKILGRCHNNDGIKQTNNVIYNYMRNNRFITGETENYFNCIDYNSTAAVNGVNGLIGKCLFVKKPVVEKEYDICTPASAPINFCGVRAQTTTKLATSTVGRFVFTSTARFSVFTSTIGKVFYHTSTSLISNQVFTTVSASTSLFNPTSNQINHPAATSTAYSITASTSFVQEISTPVNDEINDIETPETPSSEIVHETSTIIDVASQATTTIVHAVTRYTSTVEPVPVPTAGVASVSETDSNVATTSQKIPYDECFDVVEVNSQWQGQMTFKQGEDLNTYCSRIFDNKKCLDSSTMAVTKTSCREDPRALSETEFQINEIAVEYATGLVVQYMDACKNEITKLALIDRASAITMANSNGFEIITDSLRCKPVVFRNLTGSTDETDQNTSEDEEYEEFPTVQAGLGSAAGVILVSGAVAGVAVMLRRKRMREMQVGNQKASAIMNPLYDDQVKTIDNRLYTARSHNYSEFDHRRNRSFDAASSPL